MTTALLVLVCAGGAMVWLSGTWVAVFYMMAAGNGVIRLYEPSNFILQLELMLSIAVTVAAVIVMIIALKKLKVIRRLQNEA